MTKEDWISCLKEAVAKKKAKHLAQLALESNSVSELLHLSFYSESQIAFRAAWILEYTIMTQPQIFIPYLKGFVEVYSKQNNNSCRRHFTKILMVFSEKERSALLKEYNLEQVIETTFEWLIDRKVPIAVQANCLNILFNLKDSYDWVHEELKAQIVFLMKDGSAGVQVRGKKLLTQLT